MLSRPIDSSRLRRLGFACALGGALLASSSLLRADDDDRKPATKPSANAGTVSEHDAHEIMEHAMEAMERAYKAIEKQIDDASKDESTLKLLADFQTATIRAKAVAPVMIYRAEESKRAELTKQYRQMMVQVLVTAAEVEEHLLAGERAEAKQSLKDLHDLEHAGHDDFRPKKGKR